MLEAATFPDDAAIVVLGDDLESRLRPVGKDTLHDDILRRLIQYRDRGKEASETRFDDMNRTRDHLKMYINLDRKARNADKTTRASEKEMPWGRAIVVPMTHAISHALLVQLMSIFASRDPIFPVEGRSPEDVLKAPIIEAMLAYDAQQMRAFQRLYTFFQDTLISHGILYDSWETEAGVVKRREPMFQDPMQQKFAETILGSAAWLETETYETMKEGNRWKAVDPFLFYPDPRCSVSDVQSMTFVGHRFYASKYDLLVRSDEYDGPYFGIRDLPDASGERRYQDRSESGIIQDANTSSICSEDAGFYACDHLQVKLIPADWKLSDSINPERWMFTWVDDKRIVRAHRMEYDHQQFTYSVAQSEFDVHNTFSGGTLEQLDGLQRFANYQFNAWVTNTNKMLNDAFVFSPRWIEMEDLMNPGPARHIRLTEEAEEAILSGQSSASALFHQLPVQDLAGPAHSNVLNMEMDFAQRATSASDPVQGMQLPTRRTATEISTLMSSATQRMTVLAQLIDSTAIWPLVERAIANRLQLTSAPMFYRLVGNLPDHLAGLNSIFADRDLISGSYDYIPSNGTHAPDPAKNPESYIQLLQTVMQSGGQLAAPGPDGKVLNIHAISKELFRLMGVRNIGEFYDQVPMVPPMQVMPDEQVQAGVQAGNLLPAEGMVQ
jgi:hypothetical protein